MENKVKRRKICLIRPPIPGNRENNVEVIMIAKISKTDKKP